MKDLLKKAQENKMIYHFMDKDVKKYIQKVHADNHLSIYSWSPSRKEWDYDTIIKTLYDSGIYRVKCGVRRYSVHTVNDIMVIDIDGNEITLTECMDNAKFRGFVFENEKGEEIVSGLPNLYDKTNGFQFPKAVLMIS